MLSKALRRVTPPSSPRHMSPKGRKTSKTSWSFDVPSPRASKPASANPVNQFSSAAAPPAPEETKAVRFSGVKLAKQLKVELGGKLEKFTKEFQGLKPKLTILQVGNRSDSTGYVNKKRDAAMAIGMECDLVQLPEESTQQDLLDAMEACNTDPSIHGIIVQQPLPKHIDVATIESAIDYKKDVDALHPINVGLLASHKFEQLGPMKGQVVPCTAEAVCRIIDSLDFDLEGKKAVVLGCSNIVGGPTAQLLRHRKATVTSCHKWTSDIKNITRTADVLVVAMGQMEKVDASWIKPGAVVIDVGIHYKELEDGSVKCVGDTVQESIKQVAGVYTPVPGGVGPLTVAGVLTNTMRCANNLATEQAAKQTIAA